MNMSLRKNKEPHKTGYFSTEATEMADNCFQVCRCSVNEFVQFCWLLTVSSFQFVSGFSHAGTLFFFDFLHFVFVFPLPCLHIYPLLGSLVVTLSFTFPLNPFSLPILSVHCVLWCGCFLHLLPVLLLCSVLLAGRQQQTTFLFFAADYLPQIVYLVSGSPIMRHSFVTLITAPR